MENAEKEPARWHVMSTMHRRELKVQDDMRHHGIECYIPMTYEVRQRFGRKQRLLVPAIRNLLFAHSQESVLKEYIKGTREIVFFRKIPDGTQRTNMVISDHEMQNFIKLTEHVEQNLNYFAPGEIKFHLGDKIKVHGGVFDGIEGTLIKLPGKRNKSLVVSIPSVMDVAVSLQPEVIELVQAAPTAGAVKKSVHVDEDTKQLYALAYKRLFASPDKLKNENEYNILMSEIRQLCQRLWPIRGYIAQQEGQLALALYMASIATGTDVDKAAMRLQAAIDRQKPTSMLRLRMQMYYALGQHDTFLLQQVRSQVATWNRLQPSIQQRKFLEEIELIDEMR